MNCGHCCVWSLVSFRLGYWLFHAVWFLHSTKKIVHCSFFLSILSSISIPTLFSGEPQVRLQLGQMWMRILAWVFTWSGWISRFNQFSIFVLPLSGIGIAYWISVITIFRHCRSDSHASLGFTESGRCLIVYIKNSINCRLVVQVPSVSHLSAWLLKVGTEHAALCADLMHPIPIRSGCLFI